MNLKLITNGSVSACMHAVPHGLIYESCLTRKLPVCFFLCVRPRTDDTSKVNILGEKQTWVACHIQ